MNTCLYKRFIVGGNFVAVEVKDKMTICDEQNRVTLTDRLPVLSNHRKRIKNHYMNLRSKIGTDYLAPVKKHYTRDVLSFKQVTLCCSTADNGS